MFLCGFLAPKVLNNSFFTLYSLWKNMLGNGLLSKMSMHTLILGRSSSWLGLQGFLLENQNLRANVLSLAQFVPSTNLYAF